MFWSLLSIFNYPVNSHMNQNFIVVQKYNDELETPIVIFSNSDMSKKVDDGSSWGDSLVTCTLTSGLWPFSSCAVNLLFVVSWSCIESLYSGWTVSSKQSQVLESNAWHCTEECTECCTLSAAWNALHSFYYWSSLNLPKSIHLSPVCSQLPSMYTQVHVPVYLLQCSPLQQY